VGTDAVLLVYGDIKGTYAVDDDDDVIRRDYRSVETLTKCMADSELAASLRRQQTALQHGLPLGSYLLKPVQRILKYHVLLQVSRRPLSPRWLSQTGYRRGILGRILGSPTQG